MFQEKRDNHSHTHLPDRPRNNFMQATELYPDYMAVYDAINSDIEVTMSRT